MKIEIWSDVVCPFCYIGKRHLELAITDLGLENEVEIEWKSFQLDPHAQPATGLTLQQYLAESKNMALEDVKSMTANVEERAQAIGLEFQLDRAVVANTRHAHQVLHLAKSYGSQNELKEKYLQAYFVEGKDLNNLEVLSSIAKEVGIAEDEVVQALNSHRFVEDFDNDIEEARQIGIRGVPFFVFNRKYALSGAQPIETFKQALNQVHTEGMDAASCNTDDSNC